MSQSADDEPPVDGRVKGAIEALNSAMERLNHLEDTRTAAELAAKRAAVVIGQEVEELDQANAKLIQRVDPFLATRELARNAIDASKMADAFWLECKHDEQEAREAKKRQPRDAVAKQVHDHAALRAKDAKRAAQRTGRTAEELAIKLGELGFAIERAGFTIADGVRMHAEYRERREGLQKVLQMSQARLASLEAAKEEANSAIGDAMENLEALNMELHNAAPGKEGDGSAELVVVEPEDLAAWRSTRAWSEASDEEDDEEEDDDDGSEASRDSYADNQFSENDDSEDEEGETKDGVGVGGRAGAGGASGTPTREAV